MRNRRCELTGMRGPGSPISYFQEQGMTRVHHRGPNEEFSATNVGQQHGQ